MRACGPKGSISVHSHLRPRALEGITYGAFLRPSDLFVPPSLFAPATASAFLHSRFAFRYSESLRVVSLLPLGHQTWFLVTGPDGRDGWMRGQPW